MSNPNDVIRDAILRYLHNVHKKARSPKSAGQGIRDITKGMKPLGFKQQEIASNLDYLIQKGWVREIIEERTFTTRRGTTQSAEKRIYKISDTGIDRLEAASTYKRPPIDHSINITNIQGVTVVGDGNIVNTSFSDASHVLNDLRRSVLDTNAIPDADKLAVVADIDTLQAQLQKPQPDRTVIQHIWSGIEKIVTAAGFSELAVRIAGLLGPLLS